MAPTGKYEDGFMEYWNNVSPNSSTAIDSNAVCRLFSTLGNPDHTALANGILELVNSIVPVNSCFVMAFNEGQDPRCLSAATPTDDHHCRELAGDLTTGLFRHDRIQVHLQTLLIQQQIGALTVHRQIPIQIIDGALKRLYNTLGIVDSMAITIKSAEQAWITITLSRCSELGLFAEDEKESLLRLAQLIAMSALRHSQLASLVDNTPDNPLSSGLDNLCSRLTQRERQVILRILDGVTMEQIAEDLGLKPSTVVTYRSRGYEKLGVSSRRELFSTVLRNRTTRYQQPQTELISPPLLFTPTGNPPYATGTDTHRPHQ
jgi:DNA-binding CsgD family transcriptional regulator